MQHETLTAEPCETPDQPSAGEGDDTTAYYRRVLRNLVEIGNDLAEMLHQESAALATSPDPVAASVEKVSNAYVRVAQSIRRTIMLDRKLAEPQKTPSPQHRITARKRIIRDVEDAIQHKAADTHHAETLHAELLERLDSPDMEHDIASRPVGDIITDICRDLGLGVAALPDTNPFKRRIPHDIAILNARAAQPHGHAPSAELVALLASAPPPPPIRLGPLPNISKMTTAEIEARLKVLKRFSGQERAPQAACGPPPAPHRETDP